jgi:hypothetical protein
MTRVLLCFKAWTGSEWTEAWVNPEHVCAIIAEEKINRLHTSTLVLTSGAMLRVQGLADSVSDRVVEVE